MNIDKLTIAKRYSKALFELLNSQNKLDVGFEDLKQIRTIFQDNSQLVYMLTNNYLTFFERQKIIQPLLDSTSGTIHNLIKMVYDYNRMDVIVEIINQFQTRYDAFYQIVYVNVITAVPLNKSESVALCNGYANRVGAKKVVISNQIDPSIIGGVIIKDSGTVFDGSLKTKIHKLREKLLG